VNVLEVRGVCLSYGGVRALSDVDVTVEAGTIHALIGPNGAGKTSLLNVCSGVTTPDAGTVAVAGRDVTGRPPSTASRAGMARTFQNIQLFPRASALDNVLVGATAQAPVGAFSALLGLPAARRSEAEARQRAHARLDFVGLTRRAHDPAGALPYGNQRLLEIGRALATDPAVLLLDEPGAGFNSEEKRGLADLLRAIRDSGVSVVLVEHDMPLVMGVADRISVLNFGEKIAEGAPREIAADRAVIDAYLGADDDGSA
jgi:ABC-type branched-subunit amino acid transport system ATPase component